MTAALPEAVTVTYFSDYAAALLREERVALPDLARQVQTMVAPEKARLALVEAGPVRRQAQRQQFAETRRQRARHHRQSRPTTTARRSASTTAVETAEQGGLGCIIYTSPSHTPDKPRWRVLCPLSRELPPEDRYRLVARLNGLYGGIFAAESFTLSQSYYFGKVAGAVEHRVEVLDGEPIDLLDELDEIAIGRPNGQAPHEPEDGRARRSRGRHLRCVRGARGDPQHGEPDWNGWTRIGLAICAATGGSAAGGSPSTRGRKRTPPMMPPLPASAGSTSSGTRQIGLALGTLFHLATASPAGLAQALAGFRRPG